MKGAVLLGRIKVTKERWSRVNEFNKKLLDDYLFECDCNGLSKNSIDLYKNSIRLFFVWTLEHKDNAKVTDFIKRDFQEYSKYLRDSGKSTATHNHYISAIKNMLEFAEDDDTIDYVRNMCGKIKGLKIQRVRKKTYLTDEQVTKLYDELIKRGKLKWAAFLALAYDSSGRVGEIIQVEKHGFLEDGDRNNTNFVYKKGYAEKSPLIYFTRTKEAVMLYLKKRGHDNIDSLWISQRKRACTEDAAEYWCRQMGKILSGLEGCDISITPHDFRRSAIENLYNGTHYMCEVRIQRIPFAIQDIQLLANHKNHSMTEYYLKNNKQKNLENAFGIKIVS